VLKYAFTLPIIATIDVASLRLSFTVQTVIFVAGQK